MVGKLNLKLEKNFNPKPPTPYSKKQKKAQKKIQKTNKKKLKVFPKVFPPLEH